MARTNFNDLAAFVAVARAGSFTRAAAQLGISQSALSQTIRAFETRLGVRLLTRTSRSVSATEAGERLLQSAGPRFEELEAELAAIAELRIKPSGTIRLTATEHAADTVLRPRLTRYLLDNPEVNVEVILDYGLTDIVAERYDAGIRSGDVVAKDMIAVRIGPDMRFATVAAPSYFTARPKPVTPQDLTQHNCINLRLPTYGGLYAWELKKGDEALNVRVEGQLVCNGGYQILHAALDGLGVAFVPEDVVRSHVQDGRLVEVLQDWSPTFPGFHLFYPSRRQPSRAMALLIEALRYQA
ncbi:DNA-binding transcriptional LysR family regulator [Pseudoduganella lurida]|uniref:DNA-binding transcriptional LysR family regulator n=1 Tax=Pseudoduganella lurida TaxID=1036180 RepID=A0A562R0C7_9BURK|nr:LysR family transcriptional regulator [Pseudoduganella lurida]TWI62522.1 DNA-binding transcriptional LysR family regulator [Pseudoduganella lurida]